MSTCKQCGTGNAPRKTNCTTCGTVLSLGTPDLPADIGPLWRMRFDLIEKAGGPKLPHRKRLRFGQNLRVLFNLWALLFGPFYYIAKGMWRKAITIFLPGYVVLLLINMLAPFGELDFIMRGVEGAMVALFNLQANVSYYRKIVLGNNGWW